MAVGGQWAVFLLGVASLILDEPWAYILGVVAVASGGVSWVASHATSSLQSLAEEARRRAILVDGLGADDDRLGLADLKHRLGARVDMRAKGKSTESYYASTAAAGSRRLKELLQESAFFSKHLYDVAAKRALIIFVLEVVVVALTAFLVLPLATGNTTLLVARILVLFLWFILATDQLHRFLGWRGATERIQEVDRRLETLDPNDASQLLAVFSDYNVATAGAGLISTRVYNANRERLTRLWRERTGAPQDEGKSE